MKTIRLIFAGAFLLATIGTSAQSLESDLEKALTLKKEYKEDDARNLFDDILRRDPNNVSALAHNSYLYATEGNRQSTNNEKEPYYKKSSEMAQKAISIDKSNADAHYSYAVALGRLSLLADSEERLKNAKLIKQEAETCVSLDPNYAGAHYILGRLNSEIANMPWYKVAAAEMIYNGIPEGTSYEKAEVYFNKAISLEPGYILYYKDAAVNYSYMGKKEKAKAMLNKAISLPNVTPDDPARKLECQKLLKNL
ncbi:MAG: tetratricopeptide (TPR) repeat protein [Sphingobacteriales bacterium]|jgi:tetratricopeptide (TPR) repeat protein